jgi:hypothetical protein
VNEAASASFLRKTSKHERFSLCSTSRPPHVAFRSPIKNSSSESCQAFSICESPT